MPDFLAHSMGKVPTTLDHLFIRYTQCGKFPCLSNFTSPVSDTCFLLEIWILQVQVEITLIGSSVVIVSDLTKCFARHYATVITVVEAE